MRFIAGCDATGEMGGPDRTGYTLIALTARLISEFLLITAFQIALSERKRTPCMKSMTRARATARFPLSCICISLARLLIGDNFTRLLQLHQSERFAHRLAECIVHTYAAERHEKILQ